MILNIFWDFSDKDDLNFLIFGLDLEERKIENLIKLMIQTDQSKVILKLFFSHNFLKFPKFGFFNTW